MGNCAYRWVTTQITSRTTYFLAGCPIATRITGDPDNNNNGLFYLLTDHLGSTSMLITIAGAVVAGASAYYQPYGNYRTTPPNTLTERGYTGHHENRDIGLTYMNARYYIPGLGRFLTADTLVPSPTNPQSHNRYSYVLGNPLVLVDPTGHASCYTHGQNEHCTDDTPMTPPPPRPQRPAVRPVRDIPQCEGCFTPREVAIAILRSRFALPFAGTRSLTSSFGPDHPTGVDWGGQFTVLAPAAGTVTRAGSDGTAGMWRIQNIETGEIREYSVFSTATHGRLRLRDRDEHGLVEPERLLATGKWVDLEPGWSHAPGTQVTIDHGNGVETVYHHLTIDASIHVGVQVQQGDVLGVTANIGWSSGTHLHYGVKYIYSNGDWEWLNPINPM
ncbi:MAG: peptidoglycan DD-metalloendopeptidase family protein [Anaerolineae bacterium]|nr:peptidoglycan DD-metalloendopeptidase family protein [Anaerolineae bacterium]